ncbi:ferrous iron transport protein B [Candidatus Hakubella thermalkaliphila]|uniref:Ferrous iron transport protein B n=1 Tax=Candidatus Hakubella thermalkaliphila TaxID=2754717 RepID=A0A6V8PRS4_9ACTN|nr:ferrous iron transport protein B [Candidatus Hakubella thermalkaliphila]
MHPLWGIPLLLIVLYGLYQFVGVLGAGTLVDFFESTIFGKYLNPMATKVIQTIAPASLKKRILNETSNAAQTTTSQSQLILLYSSVKALPFLMSRPERLTGCR